ncbi:hypothetical protein AALP_AA3G298800 [Arabis alpina]|uniref:Helicase C-terminal domain-containing protein n=1 Tax=Arabis alpina TaxID=50452 RepID=A0A087HCL3_ARAAL|nr:hypothetical protein AALP_AA3G298800 [Arabis alpina]
MDGCFLELQVDGEEAYQTFQRVIENANVIMATYEDPHLGDVQHRLSLATKDLKSSTLDSIEKRLQKIVSSLTYCLDDLGILLAQKAAQSLSASQNDFASWGQLDMFSQTIIKKFCSDASQAISADIPHGLNWSEADIEENMGADPREQLLLWNLSYYNREESQPDIRCIIFVERVITAIVMESFLAEILPYYNNWKTKYVAGNNSRLQSQTRKKQNEIVEEFRKGLVNIIVATSILEEGLDVQSCNLVVRFDPASNICSFIQSRGRARMLNSEYLMMVESGDLLTQSRLTKYLSGVKRMREESLHHSLDPCPPLSDDSCEDFFRVNSTGAVVTLSSSVSLIYFYCSRLPSDEYFKPTPRFDVNKDQGTCSLYLPKSCPIKEVKVQANSNVLKQAACLDACIQLYEVGALSDNLVPDMGVAETVQLNLGKFHYDTEQPCYLPPELVSQFSAEPQTTYHMYSIRMKPSSSRDIKFKEIFLGTRVELEDDLGNTGFRLEDHKGTVAVTLSYVGAFHLTQEEVLLCRRFQITLFRVLLDHSVENLVEALDGLQLRDGVALDYLLVPSTLSLGTSLIDWEDLSYLDYYEKRHGIQLNFLDEPFLNGRHIFTLQNCIRMTHKKKDKEHDREFVELPPELCHVIMSPVSVDMIYTYTFIPSVMQRIESLLIAYNLKKRIPNVNILTIKVLEAITTGKERFEASTSGGDTDNAQPSFDAHWRRSVFKLMNVIACTRTEENVRLEAVSIMNIIMMSTEAYTDRHTVLTDEVFYCISLLLKNEVGLQLRKEAIHLFYLLLNCPKILARFESPHAEGNSETFGLIFEGLADCLTSPRNTAEDLELCQNVIKVLDLASSESSGYELFSKRLPQDTNFLLLIMTLLKEEIYEEEINSKRESNADTDNFKEAKRTLLIREILILLNRLVSGSTSSFTMLTEVAKDRDMATLMVIAASRLSRKRNLHGFPESSIEKMRNTEITDLGRIFKSRVYAFYSKFE